jgi:hypothetical protein
LEEAGSAYPLYDVIHIVQSCGEVVGWGEPVGNIDDYDTHMDRDISAYRIVSLQVPNLPATMMRPGHNWKFLRLLGNWGI